MPRVKVPRCARLLKLKLQGNAPFLNCNALSSASQHRTWVLSEEV